MRLGETFGKPLLLSPLLAVGAGMGVLGVLKLCHLAPGQRTKTLDALLFLSGGAVSFARGLNDTPKIAALLLVAPAVGVLLSLVAVGAAMAVGGWLHAHKVALTMSRKITGMNPGEGRAAQLATAVLVTTASVHGLPVSTAHVSVGCLTGIGALMGQTNWRKIGQIVLSWVVTLPCAALLAGLAYAVIRQP